MPATAVEAWDERWAMLEGRADWHVTTPSKLVVCRPFDSPLEGNGFELLVPRSTRSVVLTPDDMAGQYPSCLFSTRTSHKSGARQCYRSRVVTPSTERPVSSKLNAWSCPIERERAARRTV